MNILNNVFSMLSIVILIVIINGCGNNLNDNSFKNKPNILLILVDDVGFGGIDWYDEKPWNLPNIDRLTSEGMKFTDAYVSPVCSPSRAALLTGKNTARLDITNWIPGGIGDYKNPKLIEKPFKKSLPLEEYTIAEALKNNGYVTAMVGKWHLSDQPSLSPDKQGFDYQYMVSSSNVGKYFVDMEGGQLMNFDLIDGINKQFLTEHLVDKANDWLDRQDNSPWFLYFSTHVVHTPISAKEKLVQKYLNMGLAKEGVNSAEYAAMHEHMDTSIGRLLNKIKEIQQENNTIIIFLSDNGGREPQTINTPFRGGKGELLEGGIRVPLIMKWPKNIAPGSVCNMPVIGEDLYPTLLEFAGLELLPEQHKDGVSLKPLIIKDSNTSNQATYERSLFWHYPHYNSKIFGKPSSAIRKGKWKLIDVFEFDNPKLFDLESDLGETTDLFLKYPDTAKKLMDELDDWRVRVNAKIPEINPNYDKDLPSGWPEELKVQNKSYYLQRN